jgi:3-deoxy-manno-octulosonate cytidylyltransferase (CMP-KDO synthetase)
MFVSIPVDEPALLPGQIEESLGYVQKNYFHAATCYCDFYCIEDAISELSAKIVTNNRDKILYISRSVIPIAKNGTIDIKKLKKNVGVFFFTRHFLDNLRASSHIETELDKLEGLEQLRWLELGFSINACKVIHHGFGIDVPGQIEQLEKRIKCLQQHVK